MAGVKTFFILVIFRPFYVLKNAAQIAHEPYINEFQQKHLSTTASNKSVSVTLVNKDYFICK